MDKMKSLNDLLRRGYGVCFLFDRLVADYITNAEFDDFRTILLEKFPDPTDTTQTYAEAEHVPVKPHPKEKECRILRLISKQS